VAVNVMAKPDPAFAARILESLRGGIPPQRGVELYSVGNEELMNGICRLHLDGLRNGGRIRFISGSWGAGKTHFFRLLADKSFQRGCLVSNVELRVDDAPLNKFERVLFSIIRNISIPTNPMDDQQVAVPFRQVIEAALQRLGNPHRAEQPIRQTFLTAQTAFAGHQGIDIDFKKIVLAYWQTYVAEDADPVELETQREELLQWFAGEGTIGTYRKKYNVNKMASRENARLLLQSLVRFVQAAGFEGIIVLFDEAEGAYSTMRKSALKDAHNNLLSLINNMDKIPGLFMVYATTPDFFIDPKHGIIVYGALAQRIGKAEDKIPSALDIVWNFDKLQSTMEDYCKAAQKIHALYELGFPEAKDRLGSPDELVPLIQEWVKGHGPFHAVRAWRVVVSATVKYLDDRVEGRSATASAVYQDVMKRLRDQ